MVKKRIVVIGLCLLVFLLHCMYLVGADSENTAVTAEGEAAGTGLAAKEKSLENALRNAVEKGFGVYIDSATLSENAALLADDIIAETRGFVRSYDILEQKEMNGIFTTKIKAEVSLDKIWESESLQLLLKRMGAPRFIVVAAEYHGGQPAPRSFAQQKVTELLVSRGFHLVNAVKITDLGLHEIKNAMDNERQAAEIGKNANAEIIVLVNSTGNFEKRTKAYGAQFDIFRGNCEIKAVQVDSRKIVASAVKARQSGSIKDAIMAAAEDNAGIIVKQLLEAWSKYLNMGRTIELVITGISVSQLMRIVEEINALEGVNGVEQREFSQGKAQLEIKSKHKAMYLAENIENFPGFSLEITHFSAEKIAVRNIK